MADIYAYSVTIRTFFLLMSDFFTTFAAEITAAYDTEIDKHTHGR